VATVCTTLDFSKRLLQQGDSGFHRRGCRPANYLHLCSAGTNPTPENGGARPIKSCLFSKQVSKMRKRDYCFFPFPDRKRSL